MYLEIIPNYFTHVLKLNFNHQLTLAFNVFDKSIRGGVITLFSQEEKL